MAAAFAMRYDEAYRSDIAAKCAGLERPPFMEQFFEELAGPIEMDELPQTSNVAELAAWADQANMALTTRKG